MNKDLLIFLCLCVFGLVALFILYSVFNSSAAMMQIGAETNLANSKAMEARANAELLTQKAITERVTRQKEMDGWTAANIRENGGSVANGLIGLVACLFIPLLAIVVLFVIRPRRYGSQEE